MVFIDSLIFAEFTLRKFFFVIKKIDFDRNLDCGILDFGVVFDWWFFIDGFIFAEVYFWMKKFELDRKSWGILVFGVYLWGGGDWWVFIDSYMFAEFTVFVCFPWVWSKILTSRQVLYKAWFFVEFWFSSAA